MTTSHDRTLPPPASGRGPFLYSIDEAMRALSIGRSTIKTAIGRGLIRTTRIGKRRLVHRDELERIAREGLPDLHADGR